MEPDVGRPDLPERQEYGTTPDGPPTLEWSDVRSRIADAEVYWFATTRPDRRPHVVPIGGVWADDRLYVTLAPTTISARNAEADPDVVVHLEDANDAVIIEGTVERAPLRATFPSRPRGATGNGTAGRGTPPTMGCRSSSCGRGSS